MIEIPYFSIIRRLPGMLATLIAVGLLVSISNLANAGQATLAWDVNPQPEVAGYMLHYGTVSGAYSAKIDVGKVTQYTVTGLLEGKTYYVAATAYDLGRAESGFSNQVSTSVPSSTPVANFNTNTTTGVAPFSVPFTSTSSGSISSYSWTFGDGTASTSANPTHSYGAAGTYNVGLTVSGPGGTNTMTKASYITVSTASSIAPVANFTANSTSGAAPLAVAFYEQINRQYLCLFMEFWRWDDKHCGESVSCLWYRWNVYGEPHRYRPRRLQHDDENQLRDDLLHPSAATKRNHRRQLCRWFTGRDQDIHGEVVHIRRYRILRR